MQFTEFPKIPRLSRECVITEKIDGTNASIWIEELAAAPQEAQACIGRSMNLFENLIFGIGSRTRWISPTQDNHGFAKWVMEHANELIPALGPGHHFGEWWGAGIQRRYGLAEKRFSLFNTHRWTSDYNNIHVGDITASTQCFEIPCCHVVPVIGKGKFDSAVVKFALTQLEIDGSYAAPGFMQPEGVVVYHAKANTLFKKTLDKNDGHKGA